MPKQETYVMVCREALNFLGDYKLLFIWMERKQKSKTWISSLIFFLNKATWLLYFFL